MKSFNKSLALAVLVSLSFGAFAQEDQVLNTAPIDVDGYLHDKPATDGELEAIKSEYGKQKTATQLNKEKSKEYDKLNGQTEKLLESQDAYIDSKIESQKTIREFNRKTAENEKRLKCLLEESTAPDCAKWVKNRKKDEVVEDKVEVAAAAPVAQPVAQSVTEAPAASAPQKPFEEIKLIPVAGVTNYSGVEKLETSFAGGLRLESNLDERFSVGVGLNYSKFTTQDYANSGNYTSQPYYYNYYNAYGNGREIGFTNAGLSLYGKMFITRGERFRPYIGAGLGYNRMTLNYNDNNLQGSYYGYNFGKEELTSSYATGQLTAGTEVLITRGFGLLIEFQYSKGFGSGNRSNGVSPYNAPDQRRLQQLADDIISANALSVFGGGVVTF